MMNTKNKLRFFTGIIVLLLASSCSHKFDSEVLDLKFYQWNLWADREAISEGNAPSCGWEELHRGTGKLVRIPAKTLEHFPNEDGTKVFWYHCRFSLPKDWENKEIILRFTGVGPSTHVYLNGSLVGSHLGEEGDFDIDVSEVIYHTRDNHLAIQVSDTGSDGSHSTGISGTVQARVKTTP